MDFDIGKLPHQNRKFVLKRNGSEIKTWDGRYGAPINEALYYADQSCYGTGYTTDCSYTLESWDWYDPDGASGPEPEGWQLVEESGKIVVVPTSEQGTLHNGQDWLTKLGRDVVSWDKGGTYTVGKNVTVADGDLRIADRTSVYLGASETTVTSISFAGGVRLLAQEVKFITPGSQPDIQNKGELKLQDFPAGEPPPSTHLKRCSLENVSLLLNGHHGATFENNRFKNSIINADGVNSVTFSANTFEATQDKALYFNGAADLTFNGNSLTNTHITVDQSIRLSFQNNAVLIPENATFLQYVGDNATIHANRVIDGHGILNIHGNQILVQQNELGALHARGSDIVMVKNIFNFIQLIGGARGQLRENTGRQISLKYISNTTIKDNKITCEIKEEEVGIHLEENPGDQPGNTIVNNSIQKCLYGVHLENANYGNTIKDNTIIQSYEAGIYLENSSENIVENNSIGETGFNAVYSGYGIYIGNCGTCYSSSDPPDPAKSGSKDNVILLNTIWGTRGSGIYFPTWAYGNDRNVIHDNVITGTILTTYGAGGRAVEIGGRVTGTCGGAICNARNVGNLIYNNAFERNAKGVSDMAANNTGWNTTKTAVNHNIKGGPYLGGNYWDDYTGTDGDSDGLGDTPYEIRDESGKLVAQDNLPLILVSLPPVLGDINGDRNADMVDLIMALQILAHRTPTVAIRNAYATSGADVNGDGRVGLHECGYLLQLLAGKRTP
ncbi:MAG: right-handed parallel beta-helix repeat-containing protein [Syntrophales bacterium]|nr:right-handed parallel beta-helix repeat-containing protein [Syntrophales bacterium]